MRIRTQRRERVKFETEISQLVCLPNIDILEQNTYFGYNVTDDPAPPLWAKHVLVPEGPMNKSGEMKDFDLPDYVGGSNVSMVHMGGDNITIMPLGPDAIIVRRNATVPTDFLSLN